MRNFKITIEYDGTNYFGWQRQNNEKRLPSVQGALEKVLEKIFCKKVSVIASGRTDTGVHALGQFASFKVDTNIPASNILRALNTYLPDSIVVKELKEVPLSFNARFNAKRKWYRYSIKTSKLPSVFSRHYAVYYPYKLNIRLMKEAGRIIGGRHNFSAIFSRWDKRKMREIKKIDIKNSKEFIYIDIVGNGFLYKMVRRIAGVLVDVGRKKINIEDVKRLISGKKIESEAQTAPARGLCLMKVWY